MMKVYIIDYIGIHSGMRYYDEAFARLLSAIPDIECSILSNYACAPNEKPFFLHQFRGNMLRKICCLIWNYMALLFFVLRNRNACFVYLSFGNYKDLPFMYIVSWVRKNIIDIHEAVALNTDDNAILKRIYRKLYSLRISTVIVHSKRTEHLLDHFRYRGTRLSVPHVKYCFNKEYNIHNVGTDIVDAFAENKVNILFFGNITYEKGIDILVSSVNMLDSESLDRINVIIAGKVLDGAIHRIKPMEKSVFKTILRHIGDDEMKFLYGHADFVALPYRKTSQSGVLEMAFHFHKPVIAKDLPYFRKNLLEFPSFGILAGCTVNEYAEALASVVSNHQTACYYSENDYSRYVIRREVETFKTQFRDWIKTK